MTLTKSIRSKKTRLFQCQTSRTLSIYNNSNTSTTWRRKACSHIDFSYPCIVIFAFPKSMPAVTMCSVQFDRNARREFKRKTWTRWKIAVMKVDKFDCICATLLQLMHVLSHKWWGVLVRSRSKLKC